MAANKLAYNNNQIEWLSNNYINYQSYDELAYDFNVRFGLNKSTSAVQQFLTKRLGFKVLTKRNKTHFTKEEEIWLLDNHELFSSFDDLVKALNKKFNKNRLRQSVIEKCNKNLKIKMGNPTTFKKGHGLNQLPIGTVREVSNGSRYIKVLNNASSYISGYKEPYWLPIQKKTWIDHYGDVPDDKMIIFLDGDHYNLNIDNLYCIDRKISAILARNRWYSSDKEITLTAIKWCELHYAIKKTKLLEEGQ